MLYEYLRIRRAGGVVTMRWIDVDERGFLVLNERYQVTAVTQQSKKNLEY